jgi:hypothetical protein
MLPPSKLATTVIGGKFSAGDWLLLKIGGEIKKNKKIINAKVINNELFLDIFLLLLV